MSDTTNSIDSAAAILQRKAAIRRKFFLLLDALFAVADQVFDVILIYEYAIAGELIYLYVGLASILMPVISSCARCDYKDLFPCLGFLNNSSLSLFIQLVPGLDLLALALTATLMDRADVVILYRNKRMFEAILEAGPQAILQVFVAFNRPEDLSLTILLISLGLSLFSLTNTLVTFFIFEDFSSVSYQQRNSRNTFPNNGTKVRIFILSFFYELFEVVSKVSSVVLLGYFCGGFSIAIAFVSEYILLLIYLWGCGVHMFCIPLDQEQVEGNWRYLLLPLTSFVCGSLISFKLFFCLRLLILGIYTIVATYTNRKEAVMDGITEIFFWIAAGTTGLWVVLMPAFVNSCHNLNVAFYSWSEDRYVTNRCTNCFYPFEIKADVQDRNSICSCMLGKKTADVIEGGVEVVVIAMEAQ